MDIDDIINKEEFYAVVINELKTYGVIYQREKKKKIQETSFGKNIFRAHLHLLGLTEVILANGKVVQIPKIVGEACNRILEQVETEGIFRKAGSFVRQKEIRRSLEAGVALGKAHNVIDVANVVKYFFRELPEPLIPSSIQETLLGCLLIGPNSVKVILLACLLLPPLTINTLSFFMQFLHTVSLSEKYNKMSIQNLAIIFTPGLMPFPNVNNPRFTNHVKIVRILIENANAIGTIPRRIQLTLQENLRQLTLKANLSKIILSDQKPASEKKKKKRRSDIFHGLRKIVGSAMGSSEFLEDTPNENKTYSSLLKFDKNIQKESEGCIITVTPSVKTSKKRILVDTVYASSAKRRETKKSRLSFGGGRHIKTISLNPVVTTMERRWSIVGSGCSKDNSKHAPNIKYVKCNNYNFDSETSNERKVNDIVTSNLDVKFEENCQLSKYSCIGKSVKRSDDKSCSVQVSKTEYEEIEERVAAIESHISNEFVAFHKIQNLNLSTDSNSAERVQTQYERTVTKTEALSSPATEQLAKCLSRGLNIRHSIDQRVIRSPSARKIGTIRRRSQDKTLLSRNYSWHLSSSKDASTSTKPLLKVKNTKNYSNTKFFHDINIKKTHNLSTFQGEIKSLPSPRKQLKNSLGSIVSTELSTEHWMCGEDFFFDTHAKELTNKIQIVDRFESPITSNININAEKTPMLPPKSLPKKKSSIRTHLNHVEKSSTTSKLPYINRVAITTLESEEICGRASIARLRAQNAGMVLAKAKLFDGLESNKNDLLEQNDFAVENINTIRTTPIAKPIQKSSLGSLASVSKQMQNDNSLTSSHQLLKSIVTDDKVIGIRSSSKADTLKTLDQYRISKSPRRMKKNRRQLKRNTSSNKSF